VEIGYVVCKATAQRDLVNWALEIHLLTYTAIY